MLYRVTVYKPQPRDRGYVAIDSEVTSCRWSARRAAARLLRPFARAETNYSSRVTRGAFAEVHSVPFGANSPFQGPRVETIEASVTIVPSVGDLGWTP